MGMGHFESAVRPGDLYLLARSPDGQLGAVMHFISHCGKLSLDTMRRVGETPNGVNEALVCRALEIARRRGVAEVSLNYAGLAHLVRTAPAGGAASRLAGALIVRLLGRRFQMQRLVTFNEKFSPAWRPRYLVYQSRLSLPLARAASAPGRGLCPPAETVARGRRVAVAAAHRCRGRTRSGRALEMPGRCCSWVSVARSRSWSR